MTQVRTRFSPSPTGSLHLGGAHTALFNWLIARRHRGVFILRIEDTDQERSQERFVEEIFDALTWLGLPWDEGPYRQSERLPIYHEYIEKLLERDAAYYCDCPPGDLEARRREALARGEKPKYDGRCRERGLQRGPDTAVRFKTHRTGVTFWHDLIKGHIAFDNRELDDLVLARADGIPTYNFAVVVDDITMAVTHVIRGEDHVPNTPRQLLIYEALQAQPPLFAHMPLMLGKDRAKLSKRHGALSILTYREKMVRVTREGRTEERRVFLNTIANGRRLAGGMYLTPRALADDGLLDVCMCDALSLPQRFKELVSVTRRTHLADPVMHYHQLDRIDYAFDAEVPAHVDGELFFASSFAVDIVPGALSAIINRGGDHYFQRG